MKLARLLVLLSFIPVFAFSQAVKNNLRKTYTSFSEDPQLKYAMSSLTVLDAGTGETVYSVNSQVGLAPASTLKTVTSSTAFHALGKDFTFNTTLAYTGTVTKQGILEGDLIIKGAGDPTLGSDRYESSKPLVVLKRWRQAVEAAGIREVRGRLIVDDSLFGTQSLPGGWIWQDMGNYYGAGSSAVNWCENQFDLNLRPGIRVGDPVKLLSTRPSLSYLKIVNELTTGEPASGDNVYCFSAPYSDLIYLRGTYAIDLNKTISGSLPDPAFELARNLKDFLTDAGIAVRDEATTERRMSLQGQAIPASQKVIDSYLSPSLSSIVYWLNKKSINLYAESLLKALAEKNKGKGSTEAGVSSLKAFWNGKLGIDSNAMSIIDGSGLSPENRITTSAIASILYSNQKEPWFGDFYESLPVYNDMKMKSGTLKNVLAYAGYHTSTHGKKYVFSFIVNNYNGSTSLVRKKIFAVLDQLK